MGPQRVLAASKGGKDGELLLLGQGQHHCCPAWLEWDLLGYTCYPPSSLGWELCLGQNHSCIFPPRRKDHIVMVNGLSMENVPSSFAIQTLKTCGKIANIVSVLCAGMGAGVMPTLCLSPSQLPCPTHAQGLGLENGCRDISWQRQLYPPSSPTHFAPADAEKTEEGSPPCEQRQPWVPRCVLAL